MSLNFFIPVGMSISALARWFSSSYKWKCSRQTKKSICFIFTV